MVVPERSKVIAEIALPVAGKKNRPLTAGAKATKEPSGKPRETPRGIIERVVAPWLRSKADITKIITAKRIGNSRTIPPRLSIIMALWAKKKVSVIHAIPKIAITPVIPAENTLLLAIFEGLRPQAKTIKKEVKKAMISIALGIERYVSLPFIIQCGIKDLTLPRRTMEATPRAKSVSEIKAYFVGLYSREAPFPKVISPDSISFLNSGSFSSSRPFL